MKLVFISKYRLDQGYGGERWLFDVCNRMSKYNDITIITGKTGESHVSFKSELTEMGCGVYEMPLGQATRTKFKEDIGFIRRLIRGSDATYVMDFPYNILHLRNILKGGQVRAIRGHHTPLKVSNGKIGPSFFQRMYYSQIKKHRLRLYGHFSAQHVLSSTDAVELAKWCDDPVFTIPNGIDVESYKPSKKFDRATFAFLGRLDRHKGFDMLPTMLHTLKDEVSDIDVIIAGDGPLRRVAQELDSRYSFVRYLGFVSEAEKKSILSQSHYCLFPSRWEAFPITVLESIASGTPVIGFNIPGPIGLIQDGGNGYIADDMGTFGRKVLDSSKLLKEGGYTEMAAQARASALLYDWGPVVKSLGSMLKDVAMQ